MDYNLMLNLTVLEMSVTRVLVEVLEKRLHVC